MAAWPREVRRELAEIADVIDPLLESPHVPRRETDPLHAQAPQLARDEQVLRVRGRRVRLVHRYFELPRILREACAERAIHARHMRHRAAVLRRRAQQGLLVHVERAVLDLDALAEIRPAQVVCGCRQLGPRQRGIFRGQRRLVVRVGVAVHVRARVHGVEAEPRRGVLLDVVRRLQVVSVRADPLQPSLLERAPRRVVQHRGRGPVGPHQLAHRLLRVDHAEPRHSPRRARVSRRRQPEPVAAARAALQAERPRLERGHRLAQGPRVLRRERAE
jgi:hypothetical protein